MKKFGMLLCGVIAVIATLYPVHGCDSIALPAQQGGLLYDGPFAYGAVNQHHNFRRFTLSEGTDKMGRVKFDVIDGRYRFLKFHMVDNGSMIDFTGVTVRVCFDTPLGPRYQTQNFKGTGDHVMPILRGPLGDGRGFEVDSITFEATFHADVDIYSMELCY